jgi:hypothetical protein
MELDLQQIIIGNEIQTSKREEKKNNLKIEFDLQRIIIGNDSEIVTMMITKIPSYIN